MPSLGPAEILVILVIALLVFGPNKMPEIARQVGKGFREFRRVQQHLKSELRDVVSEFDGADVDAVRPAPTASRCCPPKDDGGHRPRSPPADSPGLAPAASAELAGPATGSPSPVRRPTLPDPPRALPHGEQSRRPDDGRRAPRRAAPAAHDLDRRGRGRGHDLFIFAPEIISCLIQFYNDAAPEGTPDKFIFTGPLDAFATRLKIATYGGIVLALPVWLWQLWRFITPGLNPKEKKYAVPFVIASIVLFAMRRGRRAAHPRSRR